jgi:hypothetical protein
MLNPPGRHHPKDIIGNNQPANSVLGANSMVVVEKNGEADSLHGLRLDDKVALAAGTHLPQHVPTPNSRVRSRMQVAPLVTAARMCRSETALQTHMIMGRSINANANDCQCD